MIQAYLPYHLWEDWSAGMWRDADIHTQDIECAVSLMEDTNRFGACMITVVTHWPNACIQCLSNPSLNRRAWLGQAACCFAIGVSETVTRLAWHKLSKAKQDRANARADRAIQGWESRFKRGINLCLNIG
jgi:hypothetical protein